jgi:hypothetical protein
LCKVCSPGRLEVAAACEAFVDKATNAGPGGLNACGKPTHNRRSMSDGVRTRRRFGVTCGAMGRAPESLFDTFGVAGHHTHSGSKVNKGR